MRPGAAGHSDPAVAWLIGALMVPIASTLFGLLFVTTLAAGRRSLAGGHRDAILLLGAALCLVAGIGLLRFPDLLTRMHAGTKPQVLGVLLNSVFLDVVDQDVLRLEREAHERTSHCEMRRSQNVQPIHFLRGCCADTDGERLRANEIEERHALFRSQLLRIVHAADSDTGCKYDGRRQDRTGKRAAAGFVHTSDELDTTIPE